MILFSVTECEGIEYQRVSARGKFDHSTEILIGPRFQILFGTMPPIKLFINQVFDKPKRRIRRRWCDLFGQVWWFKQGIHKCRFSYWDVLCLGGLLCYLCLHSWLWRASASEQGLGASEHGQCEHQAGGTGDKMVKFIFLMISSGGWCTGNIWGAASHWADFQLDPQK